MDSQTILKNDLPRCIKSWSDSVNADFRTKRSRLNAMFQAEKQRVDAICLTQEWMSARLNEQIVPTICKQVVEEVRSVLTEERALQERRPDRPTRNAVKSGSDKARVAFDDIPGVIDLVLAEDNRSRSARQHKSVCVSN